MEKITKHIETLLGRHDYVVVPSLGGFFIRKDTASVHQEGIVPPMSTVGFSSLMNISDGVLVLEISRAENITYRQAESFLSQEIGLLKETLSKQGKVDVGRLGTLITAEEGENIAFIPSTQLGFMPINYGLSPVSITMLDTIRKRTESRKEIIIKLPSREMWMKYAAIGLVVLGLSFAVPKITHLNRMESALNPIDKIERYISPRYMPSEDDDVELPPLTLPSPTPFVIQEPYHTVPTAIATQQSEHYHVIVSTLRNQAVAKKIERMYRHDFEKIQILDNGTLQRISIVSFATQDDANRYIQRLKKEYPQFQDAWIYKEK